VYRYQLERYQLETYSSYVIRVLIPMTSVCTKGKLVSYDWSFYDDVIMRSCMMSSCALR